ncbi:MAG: hypothetical protein LQ344_004914 [Seirophora lacunosa]|nr:MAG: hypothetical protein LQ344_004914 [Seirophora lacunosa]
MDYFRRKKQPEVLDPSSPDFLKRKETPASQEPQQMPQQGDLAPTSIFDKGQEGKKPAGAKVAKSQIPASARDPSVLAAALDPDPEFRRRWQRRQIIRDVRNRGQLTKAQILARTERESLCKSHFFKTSVKKLMPLARQIAGKPIEDAIIQMRFSKKRVAKDVKKHLEYARDEAVVKRGMGLGLVNSTAGAVKNPNWAPGATGEYGQPVQQFTGTVVEDKKGKRRYVTDTSSMYVDEAWVGRGTYGMDYDIRARGRMNILRPPETSALMPLTRADYHENTEPHAGITVRLKEEATRIRLMDEREQRRQRKRVWTALPDRPVTAQRHPPFTRFTHDQQGERPVFAVHDVFPSQIAYKTIPDSLSQSPISQSLTFPSKHPIFHSYSLCFHHTFPERTFSLSSYPFKKMPATLRSSSTSPSKNNNNNDRHPNTPIPFSTTPRPSIILVPGGWQGPETFSLLIPFLEAAGYSVFAVALPSIGSVPATPSFAPDVAAVRGAVRSTLATGKDVLLVMHSWGAVVGCEALKGLQTTTMAEEQSSGLHKEGKVVKLAFIAGLVFPEGKATLAARDDLIAVLDGASRFYNDLPPHSAARWASRLKKHSRFAFTSTLTYAAHRAYPSAYLACKRDNGVPFAVQKRLIAASGITDVLELDSGHSPMVSRPREVEAWVRRCAGEVKVGAGAKL